MSPRGYLLYWLANTAELTKVSAAHFMHASSPLCLPARWLIASDVASNQTDGASSFARKERDSHVPADILQHYLTHKDLRHQRGHMNDWITSGTTPTTTESKRSPTSSRPLRKIEEMSHRWEGSTSCDNHHGVLTGERSLS